MVRINVRFAAMLEELEEAEDEGRPPQLLTGRTEVLQIQEFAKRCRRENLVQVGQWQGLCVYAQVDFIWPPIRRPDRGPSHCRRR